MATTAEKTALPSEIETFIRGVMDDWKIVGLQMCAVLPSGKTEYGAFGFRDDEDRPVDLDTYFGIASCSKAFCCFALSQLMQDYSTGRSLTPTLKPLPSGLKTFDWQTPMAKLMPDKWALFDPYASDRAALIDLVAHVTGVAPHDLMYVPGETAEEVIARLKYLKPSRGLREESQYNNLMYMAVQTLIADLSGIPYTDFIKTRNFDPIGMTSSTFDVEAVRASQNITQGFTFTGPGKDIKRAEPHFIRDNGSADMLAGGSGILSNVKDTSKWIKTLLAHGMDPSGNTPLVSEQLFKVMTQGRYLSEVNGALFPELSPAIYSCGWFRYSMQGHELFAHTGGTGRARTLRPFKMGVSAYTCIAPNDNMGFCLLSNTGVRQPALRSIVHRIVGQQLGLTQIDWSRRYLEVMAKVENAQKEKVVPRSADAAAPHLELSRYCGTYKNAAYGSFTLHGPGSSPSIKGDAVISVFAAINSSPSAPFPDEAHTTPQLYAEFNRIWCTHLRFRHKEGDTWNVTAEALYPKGWGVDKTPFVRMWSRWEAMFVLEGEGDGAEVKGMKWMENMLYPPQTKQVGDEERTIWFERTSG
ncbi:beta-lactamase/transpeptidase-like protein [Calocera viscosa TUFC12733]|uniref:Beta-lactamase/transpeptidase-like protein n=1 Tax=Calocera viscosa (strain TUFC12733) TaxID=1330018 RepID=A0A167RP35_CALVF|nr:beta-lactamase/transpeptidase-like protein [Calocera viscosa TUFC12733]